MCRYSGFLITQLKIQVYVNSKFALEITELKIKFKVKSKIYPIFFEKKALLIHIYKTLEVKFNTKFSKLGLKLLDDTYIDLERNY